MMMRRQRLWLAVLCALGLLAGAWGIIGGRVWAAVRTWTWETRQPGGWQANPPGYFPMPADTADCYATYCVQATGYYDLISPTIDKAVGSSLRVSFWYSGTGTLRIGRDSINRQAEFFLAWLPAASSWTYASYDFTNDWMRADTSVTLHFHCDNVDCLYRFDNVTIEDLWLPTPTATNTPTPWPTSTPTPTATPRLLLIDSAESTPTLVPRLVRQWALYGSPTPTDTPVPTATPTPNFGITPMADTYVRADDLNNHGDEETLRVARASLGSIRSMGLLSATVPADAIYANLAFYVAEGNNLPMQVRVGRMEVSWDAAAPWETRDGETPWSAPGLIAGADYTLPDGAPTVTILGAGWYTVNIASLLPITYGVILVP